MATLFHLDKLDATPHIHHQLKCYPQFFMGLVDSTKTFELRFDDRGFHVGERLGLDEYNPHTGSYTGFRVIKVITYILRSDEAVSFGLQPGYAILGLRDLRSQEIREKRAQTTRMG